MKKMIMLVLILATTIGYAQDRKDTMKKDWTPEQMAEKKTNKLDAELNLSDAQKERIYELHLAMAHERKAKMQAGEKVSGKDNAKKNELEANMKNILTDEQYGKWMEYKAKSKNKKGSKLKKSKQ